MGVLVIRALLFGVYEIGPLIFGNSHSCNNLQPSKESCPALVLVSEALQRLVREFYIGSKSSGCEDRLTVA